MRKTLYFFAILFICLFTGCSIITERVDQLHNNLNLYDDAHQITPQFMDVLINRDVDGLFNMFSEEERDKPELYQDIKEMFEKYDFSNYDVEDAEYSFQVSEETFIEGNITFMAARDRIYNLMDNYGTEYEIHYYFIVEDTDEPNRKGLVGFNIIRVSDGYRIDIG